MANESLWERHTQRQDTPGSCHIDTQTIFLRWAKEISVHTVFTDLVAHDYPELDELPSSRNLIAEVMEACGAEHLARVILVRLKPYGQIPEHIDGGKYAETFERLHLCLTTSPGNLFFNEDQHVQMKPGELWHFNHQSPHKVINQSKEPRIHMIVDVLAPQLRNARLNKNV